MTLNGNNQHGYTIIETMIAISLFIVLVLAGTNALLNASRIHQKSRDMRSIIDGLSFAMEDMSRNLRVGNTYHCIDDGDIEATEAKSCVNGAGVSFVFSSAQWIYYVGQEISGLDPTIRIFKSSDGGNNFVQLTPDEVIIDPDASWFTVTGAEPPDGDLQQPLVTIRLSGEILYKDVSTPFSLQTSVSQRAIDI